jgi:hypothetical protein
VAETATQSTFVAECALPSSWMTHRSAIRSKDTVGSLTPVPMHLLVPKPSQSVLVGVAGMITAPALE